ncbi:MAG: hypothetical protein R3346_01185 [Candidatus Spechtbacterales bacterium]|nr:hypothetical protein [Candidatus Spechtbacterales bacterium]
MARMKVLGSLVALGGLLMMVVGGLYVIPTASAGLESAQAMYEWQGVTANYNEDGELVDRGTTEAAGHILELLEGEWEFPLNHDNMDADDPLVNTRDELMWQFAVITYHVAHGEETVVLTEEDLPLTYRGVEYTEPGEYEIAVEKTYAELDRRHPVEGQLRSAWDARVLALQSILSSGHANQAAGELALGVGWLVTGLGFGFLVLGAGLVWATKEE